MLSGFGYPLPEEMTLKQWKRIFLLKNRESRLKYMNCIVTNQGQGQEDDTFEDILVKT